MGFKMRVKGGEKDGAVVTCDGRLFHRRADATENALSPMVDSRVHRTAKEGGMQSVSGGRHRSSDSYDGAKLFSFLTFSVLNHTWHDQ